ncbi:MAG: hypothetical protein ACUVR4_14420 [Anaerolineae bacterium]
MDDSFQRYLAAKVTVDDRALNRHVWERLAEALPAPDTLGRPLRVLEVGAGIGTMVERFLTWLPPRALAYTALDALPENIAEARRRLPAWAAARGFAVQMDAAGGMTFTHTTAQLSGAGIEALAAPPLRGKKPAKVSTPARGLRRRCWPAG